MDHFPTNWGRPVCICLQQIRYCGDCMTLIHREMMLLTHITRIPCTLVLRPKMPLRTVYNEPSTSLPSLFCYRVNLFLNVAGAQW